MQTTQSSPSTVLVLGARGRLGQAAVAAFARAGWQVWAQARPGKPLTVPAGVHTLEVGLDDIDGIARRAAGASVVVHALNPSRYTHAAWEREVPAFTEAVLGIAQRLNATVMLPGNVYNFGRQLPVRLYEDTPQPGDTRHGQVRVALEQRLRQAAEHGGPRCVVIRAGDFYGVGQGSWLDLMIKGKAPTRLTLPGDRDTPHAWAYLPDVAETFVRVAQKRHTLPPFAALHFEGHTVCGRDWAAALSTPEHPARIKHMPWPVLRLLALFSPVLATACNMRYLWQRPHALDNTALTALIGPEPHTPFAQAVQKAHAALGTSAP